MSETLWAPGKRCQTCGWPIVWDFIYVRDGRHDQRRYFPADPETGKLHVCERSDGEADARG